jgi:Xaa-Pro aminopeptidase
VGHYTRDVFDFAERRRRLGARMEAAGVDLLFLQPSSDLEYLTGVERQIPTFGQSQYAHGWVAGAFFRPGADPVFVLPRMMALFDVAGDMPGEVVVVNERDDGPEIFERTARGLGETRTLAVGDRAWAETLLGLQRALSPERVEPGSGLVNELRRTKGPDELAAMVRAAHVCDATIARVAPQVRPGVTTLELVQELEHCMSLHGSRVPSFTTHVFTHFVGGKNSAEETRTQPLVEGDVVMFDFGAVVDGYCSDFGRTVCIGEPPAQVREAYALVLAAQEAGRTALRPGVPAREVNRACREPIEAAGYGDAFKHRMGHGIGMDVHERPFVSEEDETPLESGMTFTDEPSILLDEWGVRIEDVVVCEPQGGRKLNAFSPALIVNG